MNLIANIIICLSIVVTTNLFCISAQANTQETDQTTTSQDKNQNTNNNNAVTLSSDEQDGLNSPVFAPDTIYTEEN